MLRAALADVRARRGRALLAAAGVAAAALMAGTAITVSYALGTGFDRAAERADLPDVIVRFDPRAVADVDARVRALPNVRARSYRYEGLGFQLRGGAHATSNGAVEVALGRPRGYAVVSGQDLSGCGCDAIVERGLAQKWGMRPGSSLRVEGFGGLRVRGIAVAPDNVAFPLSSVARVWVTQAAVRRAYGRPLEEANTLQVWARNREALAPMLVQAREASFGLTDVRILTRAGVRVLIDRAAGLIVALLVAFSVVALAAATTMLAASAHADVQRRLATIGIERALGFRPTQVAARHALAAALVAAPAAALGLVGGALLATGPSSRLLEAVNQLPPGAALAWPLAGAFLATVGVVAAASAVPAWRAASKPPATILRGADIATAAPRLAVTAGAGGLAALGVRLIAARRARALAVIAVLGISTAVVLLMLGLASAVDRLAHDPLVLGKRYQLQLPMPASGAGAVRRVPGVDAAPRYTVEAADSFDLGETMKLIAYPGDHRPFESAPLAAGRRLATPYEAEVGTGLADALGLAPGATLPALLPNGRELRFRVVGVIRALDNDGRVAFVRSRRLLSADPAISPLLVVRVRPHADIGAVRRRIADTTGTPPSRPGAATPRTGGFLSILAELLRVVAAVNGLICLYVVVQALAITARDRRHAIALLRALGARRRAVATVFAGAALAVAVPGALTGALLEREVLAPVVSRFAGDYVSLPLGTRAADIAIVAAGLVALAALAAAWTSRRSAGEPIVAGLREE